MVVDNSSAGDQISNNKSFSLLRKVLTEKYQPVTVLDSCSANGNEDLRSNIDEPTLGLFSVDRSTGIQTPVSSSGSCLSRLEVDIDGDEMYRPITPLSSPLSLTSSTSSGDGEFTKQKYIDADISVLLKGTRRNTHRSSLVLSFLATNMTLEGYQISEKQKYRVSINILNYCNDTMEGILNIYGLTSQYNKISTYFKGYHEFESRFTSSSSSSSTKKKKNWDSVTKGNDRVDELHNIEFAKLWNIDLSDRKRYTLMRWKEENLYLDFTKKSIEGVSFQGFYYIVLDNWKKELNGFYYHPRARNFQRLELSLVSDSTGNGSSRSNRSKNFFNTYQFS